MSTVSVKVNCRVPLFMLRWKPTTSGSVMSSKNNNTGLASIFSTLFPAMSSIVFSVMVM